MLLSSMKGQTMKNKMKGFIDSGEVYVDGKFINPKYSLDVINHSPTGFSWGYGGSGPAQLALAILLEFADRETAVNLYQTFKWEVIANIPQEDFEAELDVRAWISGKQKEHPEELQKILPGGNSYGKNES